MSIRIADKLPVEALPAQNAIREAVLEWGEGGGGNAALAQVASAYPDTFFYAAFALLEAPPSACPGLRPLLLDCPEFLTQLIDPERLTYNQLKDAYKRLAHADRRLDVRLARLAPGRSEDFWHLDAESILRVLAVLDELSPGPRLVLVLSHLAAHPDKRVASKAALLLGRRIQNRSWAERFIQSPDTRIQANVVESLWGRRVGWAKAMLWRAAAMENNRVVGNAIYGLHLLGELKAAAMAQHMMGDPRPQFRATAAWVMGKMGNPEFETPLLLALSDADSRVRNSAVRGVQLLIKARQAAEAAGLAPSKPPRPESLQERNDN